MKRLALISMVGSLLVAGSALNEAGAALFRFEGDPSAEHFDTTAVSSFDVSPTIKITLLGESNGLVLTPPVGAGGVIVKTALLSEPSMPQESRLLSSKSDGSSEELALFWGGTVQRYRSLEFFTKDGNFSRRADGSVAEGATYQQIERPAELARRDQKSDESTQNSLKKYAYKSTDGKPTSGGELWLMLYNLRQAVKVEVENTGQDRGLLYGGFAFVGIVLTWRVRRKRQIDDERDLESYLDRATGDYSQSRRSTSSSFIRLVSHEDGSAPKNVLICDSPVRRISY